MSVPIGWGNRQNSDYCDPQALLQRPKAEDWKEYEVEIRHMRQEEEERQRLKNVAGMGNVPIGWASRDNAKPLEDLLTSKSSISVAAAEAIYKKEYPNQDINDLLFNKSLEPAKPVSAPSSSSVSMPPPPPTTTTTTTVDPCTKAELNDIKSMLTGMQAEFQTGMGNIVALVMEMGNRMAVLEEKVDRLVEHQTGTDS